MDPSNIFYIEGAGSGRLSKELFWGLGFGIEETAEGKALWHWGDYGVCKSFFAVRLGTNSGVVFLTNSENGLSLGPEILAKTIGGQHPAFDWLKSGK